MGREGEGQFLAGEDRAEVKGRFQILGTTSLGGQERKVAKICPPKQKFGLFGVFRKVWSSSYVILFT
jgi:hypothetical protein